MAERDKKTDKNEQKNGNTIRMMDSEGETPHTHQTGGERAFKFGRGQRDESDQRHETQG